MCFIGLSPPNLGNAEKNEAVPPKASHFYRLVIKNDRSLFCGLLDSIKFLFQPVLMKEHILKSNIGNQCSTRWSKNIKQEAQSSKPLHIANTQQHKWYGGQSRGNYTSKQEAERRKENDGKKECSSEGGGYSQSTSYTQRNLS